MVGACFTENVLYIIDVLDSEVSIISGSTVYTYLASVNLVPTPVNIEV